jgi:hypothetical protein
LLTMLHCSGPGCLHPPAAWQFDCLKFKARHKPALCA